MGFTSEGIKPVLTLQHTNMTKADLIDALAHGADLTKVKAEEAITIALEAIKQVVTKGQSVQLVGFGSFSSGARAAR